MHVYPRTEGKEAIKGRPFQYCTISSSKGETVVRQFKLPTRVEGNYLPQRS